MLERETDATHINGILNHPDVRPWVAPGTHPLDIQHQLDNRANVLLMGEHGGLLFLQLIPGIYEVHTQVRPDGRGEWTNRATGYAGHWMFTRTEAYEILTRVPKGHIAARAAARHMMDYEFTRPDCLFMGKVRPVDIYGRRIQEWAMTAPGLIERGEWFHGRLGEEAKRLGIEEPPHEPDENHDRYVGAAVEMMTHGQLLKGINFYNRWALVSRHKPVTLIAPDVIGIDSGIALEITGNDFKAYHVPG